MNQLEVTVRDVVERARAGDQVAMGILAETRDNAKSGNPKAKESIRLIKRYIRSNPPKGFIGDDHAAVSVNTNPKALYALWACPLSKFPIVFMNASPFVKMWEAIACCVHKDTIKPDSQIAAVINVPNSRLGDIVRRAIQIQLLKNPNFPISKYCPQSGWEMGE